MLKKKELTLIPTRENKHSYLAYLGGSVDCMGLITNRANHFAVPSGIQVHYQPIYHNIYILEDKGRKIHDGDWYIVVADGELHQCMSGEPFPDARKVIATSDPDLYSFRRKACPTCHATGFSKTIGVLCPNCKGTGIEVVSTQVPQVSSGFIEKFRNKYCNGKQITDVMVEYDEYTPALSHELSTDHTTYYSLKLSNNIITIKKCKDSWDAEEVKQLCWKAYTNGMPKMSPDDIAEQLMPKFNKWFEKTLYKS